MLVTIFAVALGTGTQASASTQVGQTFVPPTSCSSGFTFLQTGTGTGAPSFTVPTAGVITSWSFQADASPPTLKLKIGRQVSGNDYRVDGESTLQTPPASALSTFTTRIPVQAGDVIGTYLTTNGGCVDAATGNAGDVVHFANTDLAPGSTATFSAATSAKLDVSAQVEADADADGFGDETQDSCFTDASTASACPAPTVSGTAQNGQILSASANGSPINGSLHWLRCDPAGANCVVIAGATGTSYTVTSQDIGHALRVRKTASNSSGTQDTDSAPTAAVTATPGACANAQAQPATAGNDTITGTNAGDLINGLGGDDTVLGLAGPDCLNGGSGADKLTGGSGGDRLAGGAGRDRLSGGTGKDVLTGGGGADTMAGGGGKNRYSGGAGNDFIKAANHKRERVNCGPGSHDRARVDRNDHVRGCEFVRRTG